MDLSDSATTIADHADHAVENQQPAALDKGKGKARAIEPGERNRAHNANSWPRLLTNTFPHTDAQM